MHSRCLSVCQSVSQSVSQSVCLYVCLYHHQPNLWVDFSETWHDDRICSNLEHGLKNQENGYHDNKKKPKMAFWQEKTLELQI